VTEAERKEVIEALKALEGIKRKLGFFIEHKEDHMKFYADITKVDEEKRMVYGYASTEKLDSQGEVVSKAAIEKALSSYMEFANIREMHQASAVGVAKQADIDDKGLYLAAKVVDDAAWTKVKEGVYKGFSIGGKKLSKVGDTVESLSLTEISLVDRPANPECKFDVYKSEDGAPPEKKEAVKMKLSKADVDAIMDKLEKFDAEHPGKTKLEIIQKYAGEEVYDASSAIYALQSIYYLYQKEAGEDEVDTEQVSALKTVIDKLKTFISSEIMENNEPVVSPDVIALAEKTEDLEKAGARNSKSDSERIQGIHDHAAALGATCSKAEKSAQGDDLQKAATEAQEAAAASLTKLEEATGTITKLEAEKVDLQKRITELEAQPETPKGSLRVVEKGQDIATTSEVKEPEPIKKADGSIDQEATALALIKHAQTQPVQLSGLRKL
jgi:phage head maturation protease